MFVRIDISNSIGILELARFCGTAPCAIVAANGVQTEKQLGKEIIVPVATANMVRNRSQNANIKNDADGAVG